jgi:twitching motility protein PilT
VERIIDLFPPAERDLAQNRLASILVAIACQVLVPRADGSGRIAAVEVMIANPPVRSLIREGKIYQLPNVIQTHRGMGMVSLDQSLVDLYYRQVISLDTVYTFCQDPKEVDRLVYGSSAIKKAKRK